MKQRRTILNERDLDILQFVLDMKFAGVEELYQRFFAVRLDGTPAKNMEWAVQRLLQLKKLGVLESITSFSERRRFHLVTWKGYYTLSRMRPSDVEVRPSRSIDHNLFEHDKMVLKARILIERSFVGRDWISDKRLKARWGRGVSLGGVSLPDGIYVDQGGEKVAFELERNTKTKAQHREKIQRFVEVMRSADQEKALFNKVRFICSKNSAFEFLKSETEIYGDLFSIERSKDFFGQEERILGPPMAYSGKEAKKKIHQALQESAAKEVSDERNDEGSSSR